MLSRMQQAAGAALAGRKGAPTVGAYIVDVPSLEALALPQLAVAPVGGTRSGAGRAAAAAPATTAAAAPLRRLVVIDEVGKMELKSPRFFPAVLAALDSGASGTTVFGTVPMPRYGHVVPEVEQVKARPDVAVVSVTKANRDELADSVYRQLRRCMGLTPPT